MGAYDQAIAAAQRALALAAAGGDVALHLLANLHLGIAYQTQGDYRRAIDCLSQTLTSLDSYRATSASVSISSPCSPLRISLRAMLSSARSPRAGLSRMKGFGLPRRLIIP